MKTEHPNLQPEHRSPPVRDAHGALDQVRPVTEIPATHLGALGTGAAIVDALLDYLGIDVEVAAAQLARIPAKGPLIVVCDQAFGTVEALAMYGLLARRRPDVQVFAHPALSGMARLRDGLVFVEPGFSLSARVRNVLALKAALRAVEDGGAIGVLPLSEAASFDREPWQVVDPTWAQGVGDVIRSAGAAALSVRFVARGDHRGALAMLRAVAADRRVEPTPRDARRTLTVEVGLPVRAADLQRLDRPGQATAYLRDRCDILARRPSPTRGAAARHTAPDTSGYAPVAAQGDPADFAAEIAALPESQKLVRHKGRLVAYARAAQCPRLLDEIGRLRQIAFRAVGEGTAEPRDLDRFDGYYDHLFVWNEPTQELIGAYRLGRLDALPASEGPYTSTLFSYSDAFLTRLGAIPCSAPGCASHGAIELGRSFVRPEYQRSPAGLIMLWKGIAQYLCRNPRYRYLLGPVSISADYGEASHQLMVSYLEAHAGAGEWAGCVTPRTPFDPARRRDTLWARYGKWCSSLTELSHWVTHLETADRGVPVLVKSYLGLAGRMLAFNVDPDFGDCIDGLVLVDLTRTPVATLEQFMGSDDAHAFLAHHPAASTAAEEGD